jgi:hypothetical protein
MPKKPNPQKPSAAQIAVSADLMGRTLHWLNELGIPYALVMEGVKGKIFSNVAASHALRILEDEHLLQEAIALERRRDAAEKLSDTFRDPEGLAGV